MAKGKLSVMEGSMAVAQAVRACRPAVVSAYPITPQTHIIEFLAQMVANGELEAEYIRADSEFSAISILAGASATGVRTYTASSSQGLLLMTEMIYYLAGTRLPVVLTGANRQITAPIGLQPDHQDTMSFRDAGLIELYVEDVQEAYDTHIQAFKIAEDHDILLPIMVCMDGFVLTHVYEPVKTFNQEDVDAFLPPYVPIHYMTPEKPMVFGSGTDEPNTMEFHYMGQQAALRAINKIEVVAREFEASFGHYRGGLIDTYATEDAEVILVAMGSVIGTLREAVDILRSEGTKVGLVKVRSFRPFPAEALRQAISHAGAVAVLDRALSFGFEGILATDVKSALYDAPKRPLILGMMVGFGGREVNLETIREVVQRTQRALDTGSVPNQAEFIGLKTDTLPSFRV
ncbi:MAG: pyruvate ferredoxin oxidoreductase [Anaerolineales bacterium]|nr:pyruvate ferredoxin oxidoreductase [Anaerolineae bacterium]PWB56561.1 MAG: pyruvate ferredoxin oxidoreductase [Anaerolineales bacterium]